MYRLLKTRHLVQLLTAFYSYKFTSNLKQFSERPAWTEPVGPEGAWEGTLPLCQVQMGYAEDSFLSPASVLPSETYKQTKNPGIYKQAHFAGRVHPQKSFPSLEFRAMEA